MKRNLKVEAEGSELVLKNKAGDYVIIPKDKRAAVQSMLNKNCNSCIDEIVETLPTMANYAVDGTVVPEQNPVPQRSEADLEKLSKELDIPKEELRKMGNASFLHGMTVISAKDEDGLNTLKNLQALKREGIDRASTGEMLESMPDNMYQNILRMWDRYGNPQVKTWSQDPIYSAIAPNQFATRAQYSPKGKGTLYLRDENVRKKIAEEKRWPRYHTLYHDFMAEMAHQVQMKDTYKGDSSKFLKNISKDFIDQIPSFDLLVKGEMLKFITGKENPFTTSSAQLRTYKTEGSAEHEAHSIYEPKMKSDIRKKSPGPDVKIDIEGL